MQDNDSKKTAEAAAPASGAAGVIPFASVKAFLVRRRYVLLMGMLVSLGATGAVVARMAPSYDAELKLFITRARVQAPVSPDQSPGVAPSSEISEAEITSEIELMHSRELLEQTMVTCGIASKEDPQAFELALAKFQKDLQVMPIRKTSLISVKYSHADPGKAAAVPNALADLYLAKHLEVHGAKQTSHFFTEQAESYEQELQGTQNKLSHFERSNDADLLAEQKQAGLRRVAELEASLQATRIEAQDAQNRLRQLNDQMSKLPATVNSQSRRARNEALLEKWKSQLLQLELDRTKLLTKYEPGYRLVQEADEQIKETRAALERELVDSVVDKTDALNPLRQSVESDSLRTEALLAGLQAREQALQQDLAAKQARQRTLGAITSQHDDLERQLKLAENNYMLYEKKREEARIAEAMDREGIVNVSVVEPAVQPALPAKRARSFVVILGVLTGLFLSVGAAIAADAIDPPVRSRRDLEKAAGLPVVIDLVHGEGTRSWS